MPTAPYNKTAGFGPGFLSALPSAGWSAAAALDVLTPITFAVVESVNLEFAVKLKELYGQSVYPISAGASTGKLTGKIKISSISAAIMAELMWGSPASASGVTVVQYAPNLIPASTPWTVTPTTPAATIDLGVFYQTVPTGSFQKQFARVPSAPAAGQYSYATGVYTFATADASTNILISYEGAGASNSVWTIPNPMSGQPPMFQLNFGGFWAGMPYLFTFPMCFSDKLSFITKVNDYVGTELDMEVFSGTETGTLGTASLMT
jgi:hypothetical protein